ncbi:MAG: ADP-glyceromanno-heptose 6-epimerase [Candidatus Omnitrophica bacterium]|nr:ADP-glyceromanno-heptose 6-epimerase [Candidatus Omnitrophota bacterium]
MICLTGAAGFIGSCTLARLNELGFEDIICVDNIQTADEVVNDLKKKNLAGKKYIDYVDKKDFIQRIVSGSWDNQFDCMIHMGACSSTTGKDPAYYQDNNLNYTITLAEWSLANNTRFIYASSAATYGDGSDGYKDDHETVLKCQPLNLYGRSKQDFDLLALKNSWFQSIVGLKFFNVFGPNEYHKQDMRSVSLKAFQRVVDEGSMGLFKSYHPDFADGEQKRDFVYVKDAVQVILFFMDNPDINGIFNVGTGKARSWNDLAKALFKALLKEPCINYFDMPEILRDKYQYFTQAEMAKLKSVGYPHEFTSLEDAILDYVSYLKVEKHL